VPIELLRLRARTAPCGKQSRCWLLGRRGFVPWAVLTRPAGRKWTVEIQPNPLPPAHPSVMLRALSLASGFGLCRMWHSAADARRRVPHIDRAC
jgi:hypothetical protein